MNPTTTLGSFRDVLFWTALKLFYNKSGQCKGFRDVLFWTALKLKDIHVLSSGSFRDVLFWTALKLKANVEKLTDMF